MWTHLLWMGTGKMPQLLPHFTWLYNKPPSRQLSSELCSPSLSSRDRYIFHWATCKLKAVFKGIVGFWSNEISLNNIMKTLTFNQKALKEPINMCIEMLPWYRAKVSVSAPSSPAGYIPRNARQQHCQPHSFLSAQPHLWNLEDVRKQFAVRKKRQLHDAHMSTRAPVCGLHQLLWYVF